MNESHGADDFRKLVEDGLFLCMYGERPPGAPTDPRAETWGDWSMRAERALRAVADADEAATHNVDSGTADR